MPLGSFRLNSLSKAISEIIPSNGFSLFAWGANTNGRLGDGTTSQRTSPVQIGSLTVWSDIAAGSGHSLGITSDGELYAWGLNTSGQLGLGDTTQRTSPTRVGTATNWVSVSAGSTHSFAINTSGELYAWGLNVSGQLGLGNTTSPVTTPTQVGSATNWVTVSAGDSHSFAINTSGELYAWGLNINGRLGLGDTTQRTSPTQVGSATNWVSVSGGLDTSAAVNTLGELWTCGNNSAGATAQGTTAGNTLSFTKVGSDTNWIESSAGNSFLIVRKTNGTIWGCGLNSAGRNGLGTDNSNAVSTLTQIETDTDWLYISKGPTRIHTIVIKTNGTIWGWGSNANGRLGLGNTISPVLTVTQIGTDSNWQLVAAGNNYSLALKNV